MTTQGKAALDAELKKLKYTARPEVITAIAEARMHGDLSENAEYHAAKEKQGFIEGRIKEIEDKIVRAEVIDISTIKEEKIVFGATVELMDMDTEEKKTYTIVGSDESDAKIGKVSIESPIARSLINKKPGDEVIIRIPKGEVEFEVLSVRYNG